MTNESHSITSIRVDSTQVFYQHCALKIAGIAMPMIRKTGSSCNTWASLRGKTRNTFYRLLFHTCIWVFLRASFYCRPKNHSSYSMEHKPNYEQWDNQWH